MIEPSVRTTSAISLCEMTPPETLATRSIVWFVNVVTSATDSDPKSPWKASVRRFGVAAVGANDGALDGNNVGTPDGDAVGLSVVGTAVVGVPVVGVAVVGELEIGAAVGIAEGTFVGVAVGTAVGLREGIAVGLAVGARVGAFVQCCGH